MKKKATARKPTLSQSKLDQPKPFTPGITPGMVRQHAYSMFSGKLQKEALTLEDWVLAEKDLVNSMEADNLPRR
jgi:hypothetical protein